MGNASLAEAVPFTVTSVLNGDPRLLVPDGIVVDVTITGDTTSDTTSWVVNLNSTAHPDARLDGFFFNLALDPTQALEFSGFSPTGWGVSSGSNAQGSGGANFEFRIRDLPGGTNNQVTNSVNLMFNATLSSGFWSQALFTNAALADGDAILNPGSQLGAHVQALSTGLCFLCSDSGFASGNYTASSTPTSSVPEPTSLSLIGLGLAGLGFTGRRKRARS